ncbi:MAG: transporter [Deltaproteobacteria bacterium]|nr:transporter [Deltaproteobacteria bacterium]
MRRLSLLPAALAVALPSLARADGALDADLRSFRASTDRHGTLATEGLRTPGHLKLELQHWFVFETASLRVDEPVGSELRRTRALGPRLLGEPTIALGLGRRAAIGAALPYVFYQDGAASILSDGRAPASTAIGDLAFTAKAVAIEADPDAAKPGLSFVSRVQLPTGDRASFTSDRGAIVDLRAMAGVDLMHLFQITALAGYRMRFVHHDVTNVTIGDTIPWGLTVSLKPRALGVDSAGRWKVNVEAHGEIGAVPNAFLASSRVSPAFLGVSTRYEIDKSFSLFAGVEQGLDSAIGAPALRGVFAITYAPTVIDDDHDGVADEVDECPGLPEDGHGKKPRDGCPDYEGEETSELSPAGPVEEPTPEPTPPPVASADADADGIADELDKCPDQPETKNGYEDDDGCPENDKDGDTFLDAVDHCPDQPEVFDGVTDEDGCPDEAPVPKGKPAPKPLVTEVKGALVLARPLSFDGTAAAKQSTGELRAVAAWLLAHPGARVRVSVKPEGKGDDAVKLADTRAISIVEALVRLAHTGGVAEAVPWDQKAGGKANVAFTIVPASTAPAGGPVAPTAPDEPTPPEPPTKAPKPGAAPPAAPAAPKKP